MNTWTTLANDQSLHNTMAALKRHNIDSVAVNTGAEAKAKVLEMIPKGAEVMNMNSVTLETLGLVDAINASGDYDAVKPKLMKMDRKTQGREMRKLGAAPDWAIGSVHAVTEDGYVIIASNTGSQLPAYAYGAGHVIWVVGTQKIVPTMEDAMRRLHEYVVPREDVHMHEKFGVGTHLNKLLTVYGDLIPERITVIFVKEALGF